MSTPSALLVCDTTPLNHNNGRIYINQRLWCDDRDGYRVIFCRHEILYRVALNDAPHMALVAVMLRQSALASQSEIAAAFGHSVATQRRWETRYCQHGSAGLQARTSTGRKPALDLSQRSFVLRWFHAGVHNREMAKRLAVSEATIRRVLHKAGLQRRPPPEVELPWDGAAATSPQAPVELLSPDTEVVPPPATEESVSDDDARPAATTPDVGLAPPSAAAPPLIQTVVTASSATAGVLTIDCDPANRSGDRALARLGLLDDAVPLFGDHAELPRAGVLLAVPELQAHGALAVFERLYGSLGPAFYGLRTTVVSLVLLALLRIKRPENVKEYSPEQLGRLLGLDRMAEVKTLRRKLTALAQRRQGRVLMNELARLRLARDEERLAFLYLDGHVREYSGKEPLAKTKKAQRAVATCAATDTWVHDAHGEPLLVVTSEMNAGLTQVLEAIVVEAKELVAADQRLTVLFDRGGWSVKLFARLTALGVDVITYRKGPKKTLPRSRFVAQHVTEEGRDKTYWLSDQPRVRVGRLRPHRRRRRGKAGPEYLWLRQVTVLRDDGRQTAIVSNRDDLAAVAIVSRLFGRWRQENYFKYMAEEFALDALVEYGVDDVSEQASRPNPERKRVAKERQRVRAERTQLRAQLGAAADANEEKRRPTMRGFKVAQAKLGLQLEMVELKEKALTEQLRQLPRRVPAEGLKTLKTEKKLIVDAIKMIAYQLETALLGRLQKHYARTDDEGRTLLHAAFQACARMEVMDRELRITIAAQSSPHRSAALAGLCHELDTEALCYPGSNLRVRLAVDGLQPLTE